MPGYARLPSTPPPPTRAPFRWVTGWAIFAPWAMVAHGAGRKVGLPLPVALSGRSCWLFWPLPQDWGGGAVDGLAMAFFRGIRF